MLHIETTLNAVKDKYEVFFTWMDKNNHMQEIMNDKLADIAR
jgi:hypothetical protein